MATTLLMVGLPFHSLNKVADLLFSMTGPWTKRAEERLFIEHFLGSGLCQWWTHCVRTLSMVDTLCVDFVNGHSVDTLDVVPRSSELIVPSSIERSDGGPQ